MKIVVWCILAVVLLFGVIGIANFVSFRNEVISLTKTIEAQVTDMKAKYNEYFLKVKEAAQVPERQLEQLKEVYDKVVSGRATDGAMMKWIQENNPNIDQSTYVELQRIIASGRSDIYSIQKIHIDTVREYNTFITLFPNNLYNSFFKFKSFTPTVPIVENVDNIFKSGKDEVMKVF